MRDTVYGDGDGNEKDWRNIPGLQLPHLRLVSDVASLEYAALCQKFHHRPMNFRYSIDFDVENSDTNEIIHLVLERRGYTEMDSQGVYLVARPWYVSFFFDLYHTWSSTSNPPHFTDNDLSLYIKGLDDSSSTAPTPQTGRIFNLSSEAPMYEGQRGCSSSILVSLDIREFGGLRFGSPKMSIIAFRVFWLRWRMFRLFLLWVGVERRGCFLIGC